MSPELLKKILDAIASGDEKAQAALLPEIVAAMAGAGEMAEPPGADPVAASADPVPPKPEEAAAMSALSKLVGVSEPGQVVEKLTAMFRQVEALSKGQAALELSARRGLIGDLVKLGAELPATAWEPLPDDAPVTAVRTPCKRLLAEPIDDLRARVVALSKAKPQVLDIAPPEGGPAPAPAPVVALSKNEVAYCTKHGLTPEQFQAKKASAARSAK